MQGPARWYHGFCVANCRDAKVCVLDWNAETQSIATTSLHSFEGEKAVLGGDTVFLHAPKLVTDPQVCYV